MSNYHTQALAKADIYTVMGSIYAEVARFDSAIASGQTEQAQQAAARAKEITDYAQKLKQLSVSQKREIAVMSKLFSQRVKEAKKSGLDDYLLPFAVSARMRQFA